ncbi:hypothetical protein J4727_08930 [Providencia rettgeri]|uniref:Uncharacterized protein n=1 Tax=Providencia rettgeri TaxID=587 RepID=A0A939SJ85_PRORE|nr:hypothetical protein [Providencia rettgeri]
MKNASTSAENSLLIKMEQYSQDINTELHKNGISIADQSLGSLFATLGEVDNAIIFLKGEMVTYTVTYVQRNGGYEISLFDPHGLQLNVKIAFQQVYSNFNSKLSITLVKITNFLKGNLEQTFSVLT